MSRMGDEMSDLHDGKVYKGELLDLLHRVDAVFSQNGIKYTAVYGTCLGAMREHGIIPWDDDVDIAVWRVDFQRAIQVLNESNAQIFAGDRKTIPGCPGRCGRIFNRVTKDTRIERRRAYLDLHVIDYAPKSKLGFLWNVLWYVGVSRIVEHRLKVASNNHKLLYAIADIVAFPFRICSSGVLSAFADWIYCSSKPSSFIKITFDGNRKRYKAIDFAEVKKVPFDSVEISVPVGYDNYLTRCYGDWRTPPPMGDRMSHAYDQSGTNWTVPCPVDEDRPLR